MYTYNMCVVICIYIYIMYMYICIYTYVYTERERERDIDNIYKIARYDLGDGGRCAHRGRLGLRLGGRQRQPAARAAHRARLSERDKLGSALKGSLQVFCFWQRDLLGTPVNLL